MRGKITSLIFPVVLTAGLFFPFFGILLIAGMIWSDLFGKRIPKSAVVYASLTLALSASTIEQKSDVAVYLDYFTSFVDYHDLFAFHHEFGYPLLVWLFSAFASPQAYLVIMAFIFFYGALSLIRSKFDRSTFLLVLLTPAFLQVPLFATRQTFAVLFLLIAFSMSRGVLLRYFGAVLFHSYSVIFFPLTFRRIRSVLSSKTVEFFLIAFVIVFPLSTSFSLGIILDQVVGVSSLDVAKRYSYYNSENVFSSLPLYSPIILLPLAVWLFRMTSCKYIVERYKTLYIYFFISLLLLLFLRDINNLGTRFGAVLIAFTPIFLYVVRNSVTRGQALASIFTTSWCCLYVFQSTRWLYKNETGMNEILFNHGALTSFTWLSWFA